MKVVLDLGDLLADLELQPHLERGDTLVFKNLGAKWQAIERQIERLGYGELFFVSQLGPGLHTKVTPVEEAPSTSAAAPVVSL